ncbi:uncharacterized protein PHACADRAFT_263274 [Phanerochaete carnosa HHB-10118-sp]|uniref:Uncharacterized protein n=1 Tax=Phanerochaete carnosa (strain HHB-10118-sp) TaxID=650164 RepID=K5VXA6_PHACS|nr:uncharacterized protein PHACADRAFT_263274 [Phanerochaete carnosa HHB-10118-sp]EKM51239.1 hypothetical protein PHACADRAFT_263274 [Phanerochaete carnosa HHB-10118-sp]
MQLTYIRLLGNLLTYAPSNAGKAHIAQSVSSCKSDEELFDLGQFYQQHFIRACELCTLTASYHTRWAKRCGSQEQRSRSSTESSRIGTVVQ